MIDDEVARASAESSARALHVSADLILQPDKLHDGAQPVAIEAAKARLIGRPGVQGFKLQRRRRWLAGCPSCLDRYEPRGDREARRHGGTFAAYTHHSARESVGPSGGASIISPS